MPAFKLETTGSVKLGSFSKNCTTQYASCGWYWLSVLGMCSGSSTCNNFYMFVKVLTQLQTLRRNVLCSSFSGTVNPLTMLPKISSSSAMPLCVPGFS